VSGSTVVDPSPPSISAEPSRLDKASLAAVKYLTTGDEDAFDHLVAICWKAKKNLFMPVFDYDFDVFYVGVDDTPSQATRKWIQIFVREFLAPYRDATSEEVRATARRGKFRYIGRLCVLRMIDEIRKRYTAKQIRSCQAIAPPTFPTAKNRSARPDDNPEAATVPNKTGAGC